MVNGTEERVDRGVNEVGSGKAEGGKKGIERRGVMVMVLTLVVTGMMLLTDRFRTEGEGWAEARQLLSSGGDGG